MVQRFLIMHYIDMQRWKTLSFRTLQYVVCVCSSSICSPPPVLLVNTDPQSLTEHLSRYSTAALICTQAV